VIVWLNGTFGCGKTTTAAKLSSLIPSSCLFDPETVGDMLRPNLADHAVSDFQHWPPWRPLVVATATELARFTGQHLIAPQTILTRAYLKQIFAGLRDTGLPVFHVVLDADEEILRQRIQGSNEAQAWRLVLLDAPGLKFPHPLFQGGRSAGGQAGPSQLDVPRNPAVVSDLPIERHVFLVPVGADPPCHSNIIAQWPSQFPVLRSSGRQASRHVRRRTHRAWRGHVQSAARQDVSALREPSTGHDTSGVDRVINLDEAAQAIADLRLAWTDDQLRVGPTTWRDASEDWPQSLHRDRGEVADPDSVGVTFNDPSEQRAGHVVLFRGGWADVSVAVGTTIDVRAPDITSPDDFVLLLEEISRAVAGD
jgi:hypothetical protein